MKTVGDIWRAFPNTIFNFVWDVITDDSLVPEYKPFLCERKNTPENESLDKLIVGITVEKTDVIPEGWFKITFPNRRGEASAAYWKFARRYAEGPVIVVFPKLHVLYFTTEIDAVSVALMRPFFRYSDWNDDR